MKKAELMRKINGKGGVAKRHWTVSQLEQALAACEHRLSWDDIEWVDATPGGNWNTARDWFPTIEVDQPARHITVTTFETRGHQKKASIDTKWVDINRSDDGTQVFIRGEVDVRNWINGKCSGSQRFCFAIFIGDSDHVYVHRAPATAGWMTAAPDTIRKRLRKLGIGAVNVIQQGDFLLKPANGNAHPDADFAHERMGSGHHNFELPQLYHRGQFWVREEALLIHTATDGIQHPDVVVKPGKYIVGTTANQLAHSNARD